MAQSDTFTWTIQGQVVDDVARDALQLQTFAHALSEALERPVAPSILRVKTQDILKFKPSWQVRIGTQQRLIVPALLFDQPVWITHKVPMRPPLTQTLYLVASNDLRTTHELRTGAWVRLKIDRSYMGRATIIDWARSIATVLDGGMGNSGIR
jgi:hypothetical protein